MKGLKESIESILNKEVDIGFEIVGDIAIIEDLNKNLTEAELQKISEEIKRHNPNVNIIALKVEDVAGIYRTAKHRIIQIWNRENLLKEIPKKYRNLSEYETLHKEHGVRVLLNIDKVYFSSKLGYERKRIESMVKEGERIFLPFAGVGIYALVISKNKNVEIDAVEINPHACEYMKKNTEINKIKGKINMFCMDVKVFLENKEVLEYDRIIMPAPKDAPSFLEEIVMKSRKDTWIHYYFFADKEEISEENIKNKFSHLPLLVVGFRKAGSVGTNKYRVVVDLIRV